MSRLVRITPSVYGHVVGEMIKVETTVRQHFGNKDYLACMHGEMLCNVKNRLERGYVGSLNLKMIENSLRVKCRQHLVHLLNRLPQVRDQVVRRNDR